MVESTPMTLETLIGQGKELLSCEVDGEMVLMSVESGQYYYLNQVGSAIWTLLAAPQPVKAVCAALTVSYEVEPAECERGVLAFLEDMRQDNLITVLT
jgi:Coenzyme PQQ synthesis protein D (PqqD)